MFLDFAQERGESRSPGGIDRLARPRFFGPQIHSVIGRVLADQIDFANAFRDQAANFAKNGFRRPAPMFPAHLRDHAKTAGVIAAFGDLQISGMRKGSAETAGVS